MPSWGAGGPPLQPQEWPLAQPLGVDLSLLFVCVIVTLSLCSPSVPCYPEQPQGLPLRRALLWLGVRSAYVLNPARKTDQQRGEQ